MNQLHDYLRRAAQFELGANDGRSSGYDELAAGLRVREPWKPLVAAFEKTGVDFAGLAEQARRFLEDDGVTYNRLESVALDDGGSEVVSRSEPWGLDVLPLVIGAAEWASISAGVAQRAELFEAILDDVYGDQRLLASGLLPARVVLGHGGYLRLAHGIRTAGPRQLFLAATDLGRAPDGTWQVLADRTQAPSGIAYAMENRRVLSRLYPEVYQEVQIDRLLPFFNACRKAAAAAAPGVDEPQIVVLSPGANSETAFDQAYFASLLGFPVVEGSDLTMRDGRVWIRASGRLDDIDVIVRRVDASWTDPLFLRAGSRLGVPGLLDAARRQSVAVLNGLGSGVLENPGLLPFLPALCREFLDAELLLPSVETWWCGDPASRSHVLENLQFLDIKPIDGDRGSAVHGPTLSAAQLDQWRARIDAEPTAWVGQSVVELSLAPTFERGGLSPQPVVVRSFAVGADDGFTVMRGGLARVPGGRGLSKDVWVLMDDDADPSATGWVHDGPSLAPADPFFAASPRVLSDLFWIGRYSARAEDLVRLILSSREISSDLARMPRGGNGLALRTMRQAMTQVSTAYPGFLADDVEAGAELRSLLLDRNRLGTVAQSLHRLGGALQEVRDQFSGDVWLAMGTIDRALGSLRASSDRRNNGNVASGSAVPEASPFNSNQYVRACENALGGMLSLSGIFYDNMITDAGWHLLDSGRALERALHVLALLRSTICIRLSPYADALLIDGVLSACESIVTYRRRYRGRAHIEGVLQLLLLDDQNPRSVVFALNKLTESADRLAEGDADGAVRTVVGAARDLLDDVDVVALARADADDERAALHDFLGQMYSAVSAIGDVLHETHLELVGQQRAMSERHYPSKGA